MAGPTRRVGRGWSFSAKGGTITEKPRQMAEPHGRVQDIWLQSVGVVIVWRDAQHDVETRRQFADAGVFDGGEVDGDRVARGLIADASIDAVACVAWIALHEELWRLLCLHVKAQHDVLVTNVKLPIRDDWMRPTVFRASVGLVKATVFLVAVRGGLD